jgi:hypothetical protein
MPMMKQTSATTTRNPVKNVVLLVYAMPAAARPRRIPATKHHSDVVKLR